MDVIPGDMLRSVALELPGSALANLSQSNRRATGEVCNHNDYWRRRWVHDYGHPYMLDVGKDWKERYRLRREMDRILEFGEQISYTDYPILENSVVYGKEVIPLGIEQLVVINMDDTFDIRGRGDYRFHHDIRVSRVVVILRQDLSNHTHYLYILTKDHRIMCGEPYGEMEDTGLPEALDIFPHTTDNESLVLIGTDHRLFHYTPAVPTVTVRKCVDSGSKVLGYASGLYTIAVIDMDNDVWYTRDQDIESDIRDAVWTKVPDIKGKSVAADEGLIITDLDDNLWGFGRNGVRNLGIGDVDGASSPVKLGITGRKVYMYDGCTIVIDLEYNVYYFGTQGVPGIYIDRLLDRGDVETIVEPTMIPDFKGLGANLVSETYLYLIGGYY